MKSWLLTMASIKAQWCHDHLHCILKELVQMQAGLEQQRRTATTLSKCGSTDQSILWVYRSIHHLHSSKSKEGDWTVGQGTFMMGQGSWGPLMEEVQFSFNHSTYIYIYFYALPSFSVCLGEGFGSSPILCPFLVQSFNISSVVVVV